MSACALRVQLTCICRQIRYQSRSILIAISTQDVGRYIPQHKEVGETFLWEENFSTQDVGRYIPQHKEVGETFLKEENFSTQEVGRNIPQQHKKSGGIFLNTPSREEYSSTRMSGGIFLRT